MTTLNGTHKRRLVDAEEAHRALTVLVEPGQVMEVRALEASWQAETRYTETLGGYFDNASDLLKAISTIRQAMGIYITLQPCHPDMLHRAKNKLIHQKKESSTPDKYITRYRWLLIDSDPERVSLISSTDEEHERALVHSRAIRDALSELGWPAPIEADSGNGSHLLYRIDLPVEDADLVKRTLEGLAARFDVPGLHIDKTVYNPARICKLYGTLACKGDNTTERPHRLSRLLAVPSLLHVVSREQLDAITLPKEGTEAQAPPTQKPQKNKKTASSFDLAAWIEDYGIETYGPQPYQGGTRWVLKTCAWDTSHTDRSAVLIQLSSGAIAAKCHHDSCHGKQWEDFRVIYEPDAYQSKASNDETENAKEKAFDPALKLVQLALSVGELFVTPRGERYARVRVKDHWESFPLHSQSFSRWLRHCAVNTHGFIPNKTALDTAIEVLEGKAEFDETQQREVFLRLATHGDNLYLDLGNPAHEVIEITAGGWQVIQNPPVCFRRSKSMLPLPVPVTGGTLDELKQFINIAQEDWILLLAWLVGAFHPTGPYPVLALHGEHGTAKSTTTKVLRALIDPAKAALRKEPRDDQAFAIMSHNNYVVALDNLSHLSARLSDNMCTLATGAGDAYRTLYANEDETIFDACRPQVFNGIEELATRGDLVDRCLSLQLSEIPDGERRDERSYWQAFEAARPRILGALLDAVSLALRNLPTTHLEKLPRMADFALWVQAAEPCLTTKPGAFLAAYQNNKEERIGVELENSPVAQAVLTLMQETTHWTSTPAELETKLKAIAGEDITRKKSWPQNAKALSGILKRLAPSLRASHIHVHRERGSKARTITISHETHTFTFENDPPAAQGPSDGPGTMNDAPFASGDAKMHTMTQAQKVCVTPSTGSISGVVPTSDAHDANFAYSDNSETAQQDTAVPQQTQTSPCATRWEKHRAAAHQEMATQECAGIWWCERCSPQRTLMESGQRLDYPLIRVRAPGGFTVQTGRAVWLKFAQEAGYALVQRALEVVQQMEQPDKGGEREVFTL